MKSSEVTILFAEDNLAIQKAYEKIFVKEGYKVLMAAHGGEVLETLKTEKVNLLVTDLEMPGMNTLELFPILKAEYARLPVIIVSGHYADLQYEFQNKGFNIVAFLNKPVPASVLKDKIREVLKIK